VVIKRDDAVHLGARQVQDVGDQRFGVAVDVAEFLLQGMEDGQQRPRLFLLLNDDGAGGFGIPGRIRGHGTSPGPRASKYAKSDICCRGLRPCTSKRTRIPSICENSHMADPRPTLDLDLVWKAGHQPRKSVDPELFALLGAIKNTGKL